MADAQVGLATVAMRTAAGEPAGLAIIPYGVGAVSEKHDAGDNWELSITVGGNVTGSYGILIGFQKLDVGALPGLVDSIAKATTSDLSSVTETLELAHHGFTKAKPPHA